MMIDVNSIAGVDSTFTTNTADNNTKTSDTYFASYMDKATLGYGDYLEQIFQKAADTYHVSKDLLKAMAKAESNFKANETSSAGAMGIMQLMPATAASLGVTDAYDPEQNIMGGAKYISQLLERYNGNVSYALAAYNAGSGNVAKYGGIPPFKETQTYIARIQQYLEEGVTIPDSSGTVSPASQAQTGGVSTDTSAGTSGSALQDVMTRYFDHDDYLEFLQLFTKIIYEKMTGEQLSTETTADPEKTNAPAEKAEEETAEPVKYLTMRVKDANGNVSTYRQGDPANSDAYIAYQNMTAGNRNRMSVYLTPR